MIYLYIVIVLVCVGGVLWSFVAFNAVLEQRRKVNLAWEEVAFCLEERTAVIDEVLGHSETSGFPLDTAAIDSVMNQDEGLDWQDVPRRAKLQQQIGQHMQLLIGQLQEQPEAQKNAHLQELLQQFLTSQTALDRAADTYNHHARHYNGLLAQPANRIIAGIIGFIPVPYYTAA